MPDLRGLYQEVILDHSKKPRNYRVLEGAGHQAEGYNPLCGDRITIYVKIENGRINDLSFQGSGCAISTSSASLLTETLKGKTLDEADALFEKFHALVTGEANGDQTGDASLGKLTVFSGVAEFPVRVKCATLAWHTLRSALKGEKSTVTTE
ncbi:MAG: SUF system NifU family Fe-S cluster assembly protein [Acidobacteria bacterium]|nr:MAG: SUF system NifU family Fe-S cluster assembly protein [Acidobacteriota bacterium]